MRRCLHHPKVGCTMKERRTVATCLFCLTDATIHEFTCMFNDVMSADVPLSLACAAFRHMDHIAKNLNSLKHLRQTTWKNLPEERKESFRRHLNSLKKAFGHVDAEPRYRV